MKSAQFIATSALFLGALPAAGQDLGSAVTRSQQVLASEAAQRARTVPARIEDGEVAPEETGVFVLRTREIFSVEAGIGGGYTDNAEKNADTQSESAFATGFVDIGVDTRIGGMVDAGAHFSASMTSFADADDADFGSAFFSIYAGEEWFDSVYVLADANLGYSTGEDFDLVGGTVVGSLGLTVSRPTVVHPRLVLTPFATVRALWAEDDELDSRSIGAGVRGDVYVRNDIVVSPVFSYRRVDYPDFFEDVTFVERDDDQFVAAVAAEWRISENATLGGTISYLSNRSSLEFSDYDSLDANALISLRANF